jgi:hypothetical protein
VSRPKVKRRFIPGDAVEAQPIGPCPFCGGALGVIDTEEKQAVLHSEPSCQKFQDEEPLTFLRNARMAAVGPLPDDDEWPMPVKQDKPS